MNTGQMLLTMGAMILLAFVILRTNSNYLNNTIYMQETKYGVLATSLATSMIERASSLSYDENTDGQPSINTNSLTKSNKLGPETSETFDTFDDFDDYKGYSVIDTTEQSAIFNLSCDVCYVNESNPDQPTNSRTWHKKLTVTVTSEMMRDTIKISSIFSYWYFR